VIAAALLAATGCAQTPLAEPQSDQMAKAFPMPEPGRGALYIYRGGIMGFARPIDVQVVGGATASLMTNNYLRLEGPPGRSRSIARSATRPTPRSSRSARVARVTSRCR
jgi:hypothetical protein